MKKCVLSVDIGTTSLKAGIITADGEVVFVCTELYSAPDNRFVAESWLWALKAAVEKILNNFGSLVEIIAISISGNGPTLVASNGMTIRWNESGNFGYEGKSLFIPKLLHFQTMMNEAYSEADLVFSGPEFLLFNLTGKAATILPEKRFLETYWTKEELDDNGLDISKLPSFVDLGTNFGNLTPNAMTFLGLNSIPVFGVGPDFIAALIGTKTTQAGRLCDRCGSSEGLNFCLDKEIYAENVRTLPSVKEGLWNLSVLIPDSGALPEEERLIKVKNGLDTLREVAEKNNIAFPNEMTVSGGQIFDKEFLKRKESFLGLKLIICQCEHAELLGDAFLAWSKLNENF